MRKKHLKKLFLMTFIFCLIGLFLFSCEKKEEVTTEKQTEIPALDEQPKDTLIADKEVQ